MPKRHTRADSHKEAERLLKRICISVESYARQALGLEIDPALSNPFPVDRKTVISFLTESASGESNPAELARRGSLTKSPPTGGESD